MIRHSERGHFFYVKGMVKLTKQELIKILQKQLERLDRLSERDSKLSYNYTNQADDMLKYTQSMSAIIAVLSALM